MTNRALLFAILAFGAVAIAYIAVSSPFPTAVQLQLKDISAVGLAVPAALIAFCFQLRLSRLSRLDAWTRDYQALLRDVAEWLARERDSSYSNEDCAKVARFYAQAEGLSAVLRSIGIEYTKVKGSTFGLSEDLNQQSGCPAGTARSNEFVRIFEDSMYEHIRAAPQYISTIFR